MLDVALRRADGSREVDPALLKVRQTPPLAVTEALRPLLPGGLRRGSTVSVSGSISLLLATLGAASDDGAWVALVGLPLISAEAAAGFGLNLGRVAIIPDPGSQWTIAVGALLDALDVVVVRPPARGLVPPDIRRLTARARSQQSVLMPYLTGTAQWPGADVRLQAGPSNWQGAEHGHGRLRARQVSVRAEGRGTAARPRSAQLWLPTSSGAVAASGSGTSAARHSESATALIA